MTLELYWYNAHYYIVGVLRQMRKLCDDKSITGNRCGKMINRNISILRLSNARFELVPLQAQMRQTVVLDMLNKTLSTSQNILYG